MPSVLDRLRHAYEDPSTFLRTGPAGILFRRVDRLAYRGQHLSFLINATVLQETARVLAGKPRPKFTGAMLKTLFARRKALHARDLENVDTGMYPRALLFDFPVKQFVKSFPRLVRDTPDIVRRMRAGDWKDLPEGLDKGRYPAYYRRNFHWQTDGYFSEHSAELYELGVELLFRGTADVMRRQVIPPITRYVKEVGRSDVKLLDVACGTGRLLHQISRAHPEMRLHGCDLSAPYVRAARERLRDVAELTLAVENGEKLPWADATFDVVTSVYLFHELPRNARRNVVREMLRVCKPGGLVVIEDAGQLADCGPLEAVLRDFPREFHEPFFDDYLEDDLAGVMAECGWDEIESESHLVARVLTGRNRRAG